MMLDHLGLSEAARKIDASIEKLLAEEKIRTPDLGGSSSTAQVIDALLNS
jgi:tartrate dehydrogenase/decarboxylase/D-malate dehydrogenase